MAVRRDDIPVSVVLPTYDRAPLLGRSIESVLAQTYGDFELIVVDDGSRDHTADVVARFRDQRVRYVKLPTNRGISTARNIGLGHARGAYLAFQDSDDEWLAGKLEQQVRALDAHPDAAVVYSDMYRVGADGRVFYHRSPTVVRGRLLCPETRYWQTYMLAMQPALMRRACLAHVGTFDERLASLEDLDLHLRIAQRFEFVHLREPHVNYHDTGGLTADRRTELKGRRQLVAKYLGALLRAHPAFVLKETVDVLLRRSLMPIVDMHVTPL